MRLGFGGRMRLRGKRLGGRVGGIGDSNLVEIEGRDGRVWLCNCLVI